jgi:hypothetical protein
MNANPQALLLNSTAPQEFNAALIQEPKLRVHRDGRLSYRDPAGRWTRYTTKSRPKPFSRRVNPQRRRLLRDGFGESRRNETQFVIVRFIKA